MPNEDFSASRDILDFRPHLELTEPEQIEVPPPAPSDKVSIDQIRTELDGVIKSYERIEKLADIAQLKVDVRARGFEINLDPNVDAHVVQALKRAFPDRPNHIKISFDDYRHCIEEMSKSTEAKTPTPMPDFDPSSLGAIRTDFAGLGKPDGLNRPELDKDAQIIQPIDLVAFQADAVRQLFELMRPLTTDLITSMLPDPGF